VAVGASTARADAASRLVVTPAQIAKDGLHAQAGRLADVSWAESPLPLNMDTQGY
jgi:hypothetical protein